jgi:hypothetical protein
MSFTQDRSRFGMWCVASSPLVLGIDLRDKEAVDTFWPVIANPEALAVNKVSNRTPFSQAATSPNARSRSTRPARLRSRVLSPSHSALFLPLALTNYV